MAPIISSTKSRKPAAGRRASKPVVPALPLPYIKRQTVATSTAPAIGSDSLPTEHRNEKKDTNGVLQDDAVKAEQDTVTQASATSPVVELDLPNGSAQKKASDANTDSEGIDGMPHIVGFSCGAPKFTSNKPPICSVY